MSSERIHLLNYFNTDITEYMSKIIMFWVLKDQNTLQVWNVFLLSRQERRILSWPTWDDLAYATESRTPQYKSVSTVYANCRITNAKLESDRYSRPLAIVMRCICAISHEDYRQYQSKYFSLNFLFIAFSRKHSYSVSLTEVSSVSKSRLFLLNSGKPI